MKKYLLFDLDGTLTEPKVGITTCVQYALHSLGIEEPDLDKLTSFIGPPLKDSFRDFYGLSEKQAEEAVIKYRERYDDIGIYENRLYDGIPHLLRTLQSKGMYLAVASSKPEVYVKRILEHFKISSYFKVVAGSELDGSRSRKEEVVEEAIRRLCAEKEIDRNQVYMIGDRKFDVEGARKCGVESVGVTYGHGSIEELKEAKADYIVRSVEELSNFLLRETKELKKPEGTFQIVWQFLFPFLLFMLVKQIVQQLCLMIIEFLNPVLTGPLSAHFVVRDGDGVLIGLTGNTSTIITALSFVAAAIAIRTQAKEKMYWAKVDMRLSHLKPEPGKNYFLMFTASMGAVFGVNILFDLLNLASFSKSYQAVAADQFSANFLLGIICYGLITPVAEELLFRGIIFNCMKQTMQVRLAILLSALCFGVYHMNGIQGTYGFIMGCLIAYGYVYFGNFYVPLMIHMLSNIIAYILNYSPVATTRMVNWPVCVVFLALWGGSILLLTREKKI